MKFLLPVMICLLLLTAACRKNNHNSLSDVVNQLQGRWYLHFVRMSWQPDSTFAPNNSDNYIDFSGHAWTMRQGSSEISGDYTISKHVQPPVPLGVCNEISIQEYPWWFTGRHNSDTVVIAGLRLKGDTLTLRSGCFASDGGLLKVYVRAHGYL